MHQRAVEDKRDTDGDVDRAEAIKQEQSLTGRRGRETVEGHQEENKPKYGVNGLDGELGRREDQREQRYMTSHSQWAESSQIPTVLERDKAEGDDDQQDSLLVNVPTEQERGVPAKSDSPDETLPGRPHEELDEGDGLEEERQDETHARCDIRQHCKRGVSDETTGNAIECICLDWETNPGRETDHDSVHEGVQSPNVGSPVRMAQTSREGEQTAEDLRDLVLERKGPERSHENGDDSTAKLDAVDELDPEDRFGGEAVHPEEVDEVSRGEVKVDVLHAQQGGKDEAAREQRRLLLGQDQRGDQDAVHDAIVLEMDVVDDEETG